ncbi:MAG: D-tyrosyl-tRNA(Tyr) deacylase [Sedimentisphaerales bacterium]|nr:D-tyrosyl-tRNA(Tyr) deacylase [Sedimentisphaerales bacterium]
MRFVCQRVLEAHVKVRDDTVGRIGRGLLVYLSIGRNDNETDAQFMSDKLVNLRIFADNEDKMNLSVQDINGSILLVSNFTLHGDCRKGRRPGFDGAADPQQAQRLYEKVAEMIRASDVPVEKGVFGEHMLVSSINDGPVNFILESSRIF